MCRSHQTYFSSCWPLPFNMGMHVDASGNNTSGSRNYTWVCLCVCLSVKSHLTCGAFVRPENAVMYSAGKEGQKICGDLPETTAL